jgi:hypothetical protein
MSLITAANDTDADVQATIIASLRSLGKKKPPLVLSSCEVYLEKHKKVRDNGGI